MGCFVNISFQRQTFGRESIVRNVVWRIIRMNHLGYFGKEGPVVTLKLSSSSQNSQKLVSLIKARGRKGGRGSIV